MAHGTPLWYLAALCFFICIGTNHSWQNDPDCGTAPITDPGSNIIGGSDADTGEWPWHAAFFVNDQEEVRCGATIITPEWALTAANCIGFVQYPEIYSVVGGLTDLRSGGGQQQLRQVAEIFIHPQYTWSDNEYDIAALKLASPFVITDYVRTICVPQQSLEDYIVPGTPCEVTGWGSTTETGYIYPVLQEMNVDIVSQEYCQSQYPDDEITDNMICAGVAGDGKDTCNWKPFCWT
ncbi:plasma kallikrein-like [Amphiura filiformis]|uniref:plasma kallikrein-like n=1 Tax=Amphiura filiformis TaxID=82378 RepID=UPI003B225B9B